LTGPARWICPRAGADPFAIVDVLVERVSQGLDHAARFPGLADTLGDDVRPPASRADVDRLEDRVEHPRDLVGETLEVGEGGAVDDQAPEDHHLAWSPHEYERPLRRPLSHLIRTDPPRRHAPGHSRPFH
jgi:hypothetical protein